MTGRCCTTTWRRQLAGVSEASSPTSRYDTRGKMFVNKYVTVWLAHKNTGDVVVQRTKPLSLKITAASINSARAHLGWCVFDLKWKGETRYRRFWDWKHHKQVGYLDEDLRSRLKQRLSLLSEALLSYCPSNALNTTYITPLKHKPARPNVVLKSLKLLHETFENDLLTIN